MHCLDISVGVLSLFNRGFLGFVLIAGLLIITDLVFSIILMAIYHMGGRGLALGIDVMDCLCLRHRVCSNVFNIELGINLKSIAAIALLLNSPKFSYHRENLRDNSQVP